MSQREVHILSYFSLPTDLAGVLKQWPEFLTGHDYSVDLGTLAETVQVRLVEPTGEQPYVSVTGQGLGHLFEQVLGAVIYALSGHSDNLMVDRLS